MRSHLLVIDVRVLLAAVVLGCAGADTVTRPDSGEKSSRGGIPFAGPMSTSAPMGRVLSTRTPVAGRMSARTPEAKPFGSGSVNSSAVDPARRMLWQNTSSGDRSIWLMNGTNWDGSYELLPNVSTDWSIAGSGDFNADGEADIVWQNTSTGDRSIWFMSGNTWDGDYALLPQVVTEWSIAGVGDFNDDGDPDLVWQNMTSGDRSIWFMDGSTWDGDYALLPNVATSWRIAAVGDFNGDGAPDLVWQTVSTGESSIWFMTGSTWDGDYALLTTVPPAWRIAATADFDGDADPDLVWQNTTTGERAIWLMEGSTWGGSYASLPTVSTEWEIAGVFDDDVIPASDHLVINEADYDQIGVDNAEYVELYNGTPSAIDLQGLALVLVNGTQGNPEYRRVALSGVLAPGQYAVIRNGVWTVPEGTLVFDFGVAQDAFQNGSPDGVALINTQTNTLIDALSYEGSITAAMITGFSTPVSLVEGTVLPTGVADSNTIRGALIRSPNGTDADNAATDWCFSGTLTPGAANVSCPQS
jgi:hypothetical protein